jgi:hypothetical protein
VVQLGVNAHGEVLEPGRVPDCYLGLLLDPPGDQHPGRVLVVAPASLLHPCIPSQTALCCTSWGPATPSGSHRSWCSWPT